MENKKNMELISKNDRKTVQTVKKVEIRPAARQLHAVRQPRTVTIRKEERAPFPKATMFMIFVLTIMFIFMIINFWEIDNYNKEIARLQNQVAPVVENGEIAAVLVEDEATVKRFFREDGYFRLQPENSTMDPIIVEEATILGRVVGLLRTY